MLDGGGSHFSVRMTDLKGAGMRLPPALHQEILCSFFLVLSCSYVHMPARGSRSKETIQAGLVRSQSHQSPNRSDRMGIRESFQEITILDVVLWVDFAVLDDSSRRLERDEDLPFRFIRRLPRESTVMNDRHHSFRFRFCHIKHSIQRWQFCPGCFAEHFVHYGHCGQLAQGRGGCTKGLLVFLHILGDL